MGQIRKIIRWLLLVITILLIVSGFGIVNYQIVGTLTLGILTKPLAFRLHNWLAWPFVILLFLHTVSYVKIFRRNNNQ
jgi:cytochrome b subunit of formate dehydrogenase